MTIANVALSNTFNEFRTTTNLVITEVNKFSDGTGDLVVDSITANTFTGVSSDLNISANTGTDVVSLVTETLRIVGTNGISTSIASSSNTINVNLETSGVTAGTYGSSSQVPQIVIDAQGRITSSSNVSVAGVSAFNYHSGNANFQILTSAGGSLTATIGQHLGTSASVSFQDLTVTGNVLFTGNTTTINANNLIVEDNIIQIGKDNVTDIVDLGFIGHYNNGSNVHTGLFRDATDSTWKFFQNYPIEPATNTNIDTSNASFEFANVTAHNITANGTFSGSGASLTNIPNSATTASSSNGASTIVARDASGSFTANTVTATTFIGSGAQLTGIAAGGGLFNTSISTAAALAVTTAQTSIYTASATSGKRYVIHSIHVTNISDTDVSEITATINGSTYSDITIANTIPVPIGSSVELLKKPKVLQPSDVVQLVANTSSGLHSTITVEEITGTQHFGAGVDITTSATYTTLHTATANSVIESILLSNDDGTNDVKVTVAWTSSGDVVQGYYSYNLIVPADATIELLEQPKFLQSGYKIRVQANQSNRIEAVIAGKTV